MTFRDYARMPHSPLEGLAQVVADTVGMVSLVNTLTISRINADEQFSSDMKGEASENSDLDPRT